MKLYVNGWDKFNIITRKAGTSDKEYNFSYKYEAIKEYYEKVSTMDEWDDGSKSKIPHFVRYEWRILYISRIDNPDTLMFRDIENDEIAGREIILTPHIDMISRRFKALIKDELREIDLFPHFNGEDETPNRGFAITFVNADTILNIDMVDPNAYVAGIGGTTDPVVEGQVQ